MKQEKDRTTHEFTLDRFEEDKAVLVDENDEELILPKKILPKGLSDGEIIVLTIATNEKERKIREQKAKDILNEILGNS